MQRPPNLSSTTLRISSWWDSEHLVLSLRLTQFNSIQGSRPSQSKWWSRLKASVIQTSNVSTSKKWSKRRLEAKSAKASPCSFKLMMSWIYRLHSFVLRNSTPTLLRISTWENFVTTSWRPWSKQSLVHRKSWRNFSAKSVQLMTKTPSLTFMGTSKPPTFSSRVPGRILTMSQ